MRKKIFYFLLITFLLITPAYSFAAELIPCDGPDCDFNSVMTLINNVINFVLFKLALPICAIMFAYAGFLLVTAGGEAAHARTKAKSIFMNAAIGFALAAGCWVIISTILTILGYDGSWIGLRIGL